MRFVRRAWGWYYTLWDAASFKVKLLRFHANKSCSLQYHHFRHELWLVLRGGGLMQLNGKTIPVITGDHILVPKLSRHKFKGFMGNGGWILEIQYGVKCSECDIVRIEE